ncbi:hypothetical protein JCM10449v2_004744 [Rhodotorula kratochvilovae]
MGPAGSVSPAPERALSPSSSSTRGTPQPVVPPKKAAPPPPKPQNLFTNDGSFLSKFKRNTLSPEEKEKKEREEAIARKKALEERFKRRGKRPATPAAEDAPATKKAKDDDSGPTEYEREVKRLSNSALKDDGYDMRPLLK